MIAPEAFMNIAVFMPLTMAAAEVLSKAFLLTAVGVFLWRASGWFKR